MRRKEGEETNAAANGRKGRKQKGKEKKKKISSRKENHLAIGFLS